MYDDIEMRYIYLTIVTMAVYVGVCEIFSVKDWCDLENRVKVRSRLLEMVPMSTKLE